MLYILIVVVTLICAVQAIRAARLINSALWLAGASAMTALLLYMLGATEVAVIELSVGAGLVTVLFVFAINIAGDEAIDKRNLLPRPLAFALALVAGLLLAWITLPSLGIELPAAPGGRFFENLWNDRAMDVALQIVLIFGGVLTMIGLLSEGEITHPAAPAHSSQQRPEGAGENVPVGEENKS
jgi:uncharacterized MnhB-related membrane protein